MDFIFQLNCIEINMLKIQQLSNFVSLKNFSIFLHILLSEKYGNYFIFYITTYKTKVFYFM